MDYIRKESEKVPSFSDIHHHYHSVGALIHIQELRIQPWSELLTRLRGFESLDLDPLLCHVYYIPNLNLDNVLGVLVAPIDGGHLYLLRGLILLQEWTTLKSGK